MVPMHLVVRGDLVLPDRILRDGALGILGGRIAAVIDPADAAPDGAEKLDVGDALVLPGLVDTHVHRLSSPDEGIARATAAATAGGVTTVVDMPYDAGAPVFDAGCLDEKLEVVRAEARVDVGLYGSMAKGRTSGRRAGAARCRRSGVQVLSVRDRSAGVSPDPRR